MINFQMQAKTVLWWTKLTCERTDYCGAEIASHMQGIIVSHDPANGMGKHYKRNPIYPAYNLLSGVSVAGLAVLQHVYKPRLMSASFWQWQQTSIPLPLQPATMHTSV